MGYVDHSGQVLTEPQFYRAGYFVPEGLAAAQWEKDASIGYIDHAGTLIWQSK